MPARPKLTTHDHFIRLMGYGFQLVGWGVVTVAVILVVMQLTGGTVIDYSTGQPASRWKTIAGSAFMVAVSSVFIAVGRWITRNYGMGRRSGL